MDTIYVPLPGMSYELLVCLPLGYLASVGFSLPHINQEHSVPKALCCFYGNPPFAYETCC